MRKTIFALAVAIAGIVLVSASSGARADDGLMAANAWVRFAPPTVKTHAAYVMLHNSSDKPIVLTGASSPLYGKVELHKSSMKDGVATMEKQDSVTIGADEMVSFKPGGYHFMLFEPKEKQVLGGTVPLVIELQGGGEFKVEAVIAKDTGGMKMDHRGSHH